MSACSKIRHIVKLRQMLRRWRQNSARRSTPHGVPSGHVAIYVGATSKRFLVRTAYLNHPLFKKLLVLAEEEYGFTNTGPLAIPCDELVFEEILRFLARSDSARFINFDEFQRSCHVDVWPESRPLLNGFMDKRPIW